MKRDDEITALALDYLSSKDEIRARVGDAFANLQRAPLAKLIDEFLETSPHIDVAPILKRIADTNQGQLEDLNIPVFQSYLIATCGTSEMQLRRLIATLNNFHSYKASNLDPNKDLPIAARDDVNSGQKSTKLSELLKQQAKRIR
jgi:hypothetical protein